MSSSMQWQVVLVPTPPSPSQQSSAERKDKNSWQDLLPQEHCDHIMQFLNPIEEILPLTRVCSSWRSMIQQSKPTWKNVSFQSDQCLNLQEDDLLTFLQTYGHSIRSLAFKTQLSFSRTVLFKIINLTPALESLDISGFYGISGDLFASLFSQKKGQFTITHDAVGQTFQRLTRWIDRQQTEEDQQTSPQNQQSLIQSAQQQAQQQQENNNQVQAMRFFQNSSNQQQPKELNPDEWLKEKSGFQQFLIELGLPISSEYVLDLFVLSNNEVNIKWAQNITGLVRGSIVCIR
jgi:hypothetical protein